MLKSLHLKFRYIPTIFPVVEVGLSSLLNRFQPYTAFPPNSTLCSFQRAVTLRQNSVSVILFGLQIKVQPLRTCSSVLLKLFSLISHWFTLWAKNLCFTWKKKRGGDNSQTSTWSWLCTHINLFFSQPCYILEHSTRSEVQYVFF